MPQRLFDRLEQEAFRAGIQARTKESMNWFKNKVSGIKVSRASSGYENKGEKVEQNSCQAGDIILFTGTNAAIRKVGHAGIVLKNENGIIDFIHSSSSKKHFGVTITRFNESGYVKRFLRVINVIS